MAYPASVAAAPTIIGKRGPVRAATMPLATLEKINVVIIGK